MSRQDIPQSGLWGNISDTLDANFTELYQNIHFGIYDYNDLNTNTTPISVPGDNSYVYITNDGLGPFTNKTYAYPDIADLWNTSTNQFEWTPLILGDTVDIRLDLQVTTTSPNQTVDVDLELAFGSGFSYDLDFVKANFKNAGTNDINRFTSVYMGDNNTLNFPARFKIRSDDSASLLVRGWYLRVFKRISIY